MQSAGSNARPVHGAAPPLGTPTPPAAGTVEAWCQDFVLGDELARKLRPPAPPAPELDASWEARAPVRRLSAPGRPPQLRRGRRSPRTPSDAALRDAGARARLTHTFLHHELQAAELFAWGLLAFPESPREFRRGLLRLCLEELAHLELYDEHLQHLGVAFGAYPVRDWFWERVPSCRDPLQFVALVGLGLEGANLEHSARFAAAFRRAGDERGARVLERVEREEIGHVRFAARWFRTFRGAEPAGSGVDFAAWSAALPAPLTPSLFRGQPLNRTARLAAGFDEAFLAQLAEAPCTTRPAARPAEQPHP